MKLVIYWKNIKKMIKLLKLSIGCIVLFSFSLSGQDCRWQLKVRYDMEIDFESEENEYEGEQKLTIFNNSPDTLDKLYYHLYFNAFQPGSDMDIKSLLIDDPDPRVGSRISKLTENEIGFISPQKIKQNGKKLKYEIEGTILFLQLEKALLPGDSTTIEMKYEAQVPIQIRRSGRNNKEGIDYSMAQWYPKLCNYDRHGWHADPYIGREFYAPWGDFKVAINIDSKYVLAGTGYIHDEACYLPTEKKKRKWIFNAPNVHDFVWAADPDYVRNVHTLKDGRTLQFFHQPNPKYDSAWLQFPVIMEKALEFIEKNYGPYAYNTYSFIQGGDGGMEYPMATLITGNRPLVSLVGVSLHEWMHSWFQMMLATNEAKYPWMDEGFTSYAEDETMNYIKSIGLIPGQKSTDRPMRTSIESFVKFLNTGMEEPLSTHSDHYGRNQAYGVASYVKGSLTLMQIKNLIGEKAFRKGMLEYYWKWRFRHPEPDDFFRIMEKAGGIELEWFQEYWVNTTKVIDYAIDTVLENKNQTEVVLKRNGPFPMPIEIKVVTKKSEYLYYIPLDLMRGNKYQRKDDFKSGKQEEKIMIQKPWHWVNPIYKLSLDFPLKDIISIEIDADQQLPDVERNNQVFKSTN
ncbi:MAG: M1 family metallopeptidase [Saprospiraceae bacterium]|nr:M1 family metallopeptidase [Saprospiraceae bacterium]